MNIVTDAGGGVPPLSPAFLLIMLGSRLRGGVETRLAAEGIAIRHLSALGHLSRDPGLSYSELARRASVTPQSMQATLSKLEESGAVEKVTGGGRGRTAKLAVTDEGRRLLDVGKQAYAELDALLSEAMDPVALREMLPGLFRAVQAAGDRPGPERPRESTGPHRHSRTGKNDRPTT